jgi:ABC-type phosphonate transport system ATPase subunit
VNLNEWFLFWWLFWPFWALYVLTRNEKEFYLNSVGYKVLVVVGGRGSGKTFYLNSVGYKEEGQYLITYDQNSFI